MNSSRIRYCLGRPQKVDDHLLFNNWIEGESGILRGREEVLLLKGVYRELQDHVIGFSRCPSAIGRPIEAGVLSHLDRVEGNTQVEQSEGLVKPLVASAS